MWHWQHKNEHDKLIFFAKLAGISGAGHLVLLGMLFFAYRSYDVYHLELNKQHAQIPVVFMPLYKRSPQKSAPKTQKTATTMKQNVQKSKKSNSSVPSEPSRPEKTSAIVAEKTTTLVQEKKLPQKKAPKKVTVTSAKQKKVEPKKIEQKKDAVKQPPVVQEHKKIVEPTRLPEPVQEVTKQEAAQVAQQIDADAMVIGQEEKFALQLQEAIEQEVTQLWSVPAGLPKDLACQIAVIVDWQGLVEAVRIVCPSGLRMYDSSARAAATRMKLPKIAWGKEIIITFKQ